MKKRRRKSNNNTEKNWEDLVQLDVSPKHGDELNLKKARSTLHRNHLSLTLRRMGTMIRKKKKKKKRKEKKRTKKKRKWKSNNNTEKNWEDMRGTTKEVFFFLFLISYLSFFFTFFFSSFSSSPSSSSSSSSNYYVFSFSNICVSATLRAKEPLIAVAWREWSTRWSKSPAPPLQSLGFLPVSRMTPLKFSKVASFDLGAFAKC